MPDKPVLSHVQLIWTQPGDVHSPFEEQELTVQIRVGEDGKSYYVIATDEWATTSADLAPLLCPAMRLLKDAGNE